MIEISFVEQAFTIRQWVREAEQKLGRAMLKAAHIASKNAQEDIRTTMASAGLGTLGKAIAQTSDLSEGKGVHNRPGGGFSASGMVLVRGSARSHGAVEAYTEGADIRPVKGRWLWIATSAIPRRAGRKRMTPALYNASGLATKLGPLVMVKRPNGYPLLVIKNIGVSAATGRAGSLTRKGLLRAGHTSASIIAFIGIPYTSRASRVDVPSIVRKHAATVGDLVNSQLQKGA